MAARADRALKEDVEAELRCHPDVDETHIAVKVMRGAVRLSGHVRRTSPGDAAGGSVARLHTHSSEFSARRGWTTLPTG